ncbi:unnamed protein product [Ixodes pacificus]
MNLFELEDDVQHFVSRKWFPLTWISRLSIELCSSKWRPKITGSSFFVRLGNQWSITFFFYKSICFLFLLRQHHFFLCVWFCPGGCYSVQELAPHTRCVLTGEKKSCNKSGINNCNDCNDYYY